MRTKWTVSSYRANKAKPHIKACQSSRPIIHLLTDGDDVIMAPVLLMTYTPVMRVLNGREEAAFLGFDRTGMVLELSYQSVT